MPKFKAMEGRLKWYCLDYWSTQLNLDMTSLKAKLAGGAQMFSCSSNDTLNIGLRNSESAKAALKKERIPLLAEEVGGNKGRTVLFTPKDVNVRIRKGSEITYL